MSQVWSLNLFFLKKKQTTLPDLHCQVEIFQFSLFTIANPYHLFGKMVIYQRGEVP